MKNKILFLLLSVTSFLHSEEGKNNYDPLLVVVVMIKNEEPVIQATLESYAKEGVDSFFIFDTGSTDNTIEKVKEFFEKNNIKNGHIAQEPFIDFATSRNRGLELAEEQFPNAAFLLMPDAEWYMQNLKGLLDFCKEHVNDVKQKTYLVRIAGTEIDFYTPRLIRAHTKTRFVGAVHEVPNHVSETKLDSSIYFNLSVGRFGYEKSKKRWERDKEVLMKEFEKDPNSPRTTFYLAQTFECLGDLPNAYQYYEIRSKQPGWLEENYETFYRLGRITDYLSKVDKNFTWSMAFDYYANAAKLMPHRAEPLIKIAEHYWPDNIPMCYLFARRTFDMQFPKNDTLFVDKEIYDFTRYDVLSKSAWHVGEHEVGENATLNAIRAKIPHLHHNLMCYRNSKEKLKEQK
jgi:glycosyltransferase involved in cell wall biosynthesis